MSSVIQNLLDNVIGDGARSSKFECFINIGRESLIENEAENYVMVKTSQFPGKTHETIDLKFKGRSIPVKGQTKYDNTWTCTFYLTQDHKLKKAFEEWIESIDQVHNLRNIESGSRVGKAQVANQEGYTTWMKIAQLDFDGSQETCVYELYDVFPKSVSAVEVDYSATGTILEFTVEFSYSHYRAFTEKDPNSGSFVDEFKDKIQDQIDNAVGSVQDRASDLLSNIFNREISINRNSGEKPEIESMATRHDWN